MDNLITESTIQTFARVLREEERTKATVEKYETSLRRLMGYLAGKPISKERLLAYRDELKKKCAAQTVNGAISAINKYLDLNGLPDMKLKLLRVQRSVFLPQERELTQAEYERLVAAAYRQGKDRLALILETIAGTGIRVGEVPDITVEAAALGKAEIALKGKIRVIPLTKQLCRKLLRYAKDRGISSGPVFRTKSGKTLSRTQIWAEMKSICEAAGVEASKVFPHNLRHLFARCYYKLTHDIVKLADLLGHSSVETTRIYLKSSMEDQKRILARLGLVT